MTANHAYFPESAMAIVAHPDDIAFGCSGTLAKWAGHSSRLSCVCVTRGEVGIARPGMTKAEAARIREAEERESDRIIGAAEVVFLQYPDGMVEVTMELRRKLVREIRRFRPEVVICGDPTMVWAGENYINHPDHRAVATAAIDAIFPAAGQPNLFEELEQEGLAAFKPRKVFCNNWREGDTWVSIDETIKLKVAALKAHQSQMGDWDVEKNIKQWAAERAKGHEMQYAELYRVVTLESDEDWAKWKGQVVGRQ